MSSVPPKISVFGRQNMKLCLKEGILNTADCDFLRYVLIIRAYFLVSQAELLLQRAKFQPLNERVG